MTLKVYDLSNQKDEVVISGQKVQGKGQIWEG